MFFNCGFWQPLSIPNVSTTWRCVHMVHVAPNTVQKSSTRAFFPIIPTKSFQSGVGTRAWGGCIVFIFLHDGYRLTSTRRNHGPSFSLSWTGPFLSFRTRYLRHLFILPLERKTLDRKLNLCVLHFFFSFLLQTGAGTHKGGMAFVVGVLFNFPFSTTLSRPPSIAAYVWCVSSSFKRKISPSARWVCVVQERLRQVGLCLLGK